MGLFGRRNDKILQENALIVAGGLTQVEFGALVYEATRRSTGIVMSDEQIAMGISMLDEASGRKKATREMRMLAELLPTDRDRALAAVFPIFLYSGLARMHPELGGVHVLTIDEQHARHDADLYRTISNELDWNQVGLVHEDQASGERQAAYAATTTIGADDQFRLDRTTGMLAVIRLPASPSHYADRYPWRTYLPNAQSADEEPMIEIGMTMSQVESLLGPSDSKTDTREIYGRFEHLAVMVSGDGPLQESHYWIYRDVPPASITSIQFVGGRVQEVRSSPMNPE